MSSQVVELEAIDWSEHAVSMRIAVGGQRFHTSYWYGSVSLTRLRSAMTEEQFEAMLFHIAAFELNKYCSLAVSRVSFGPYSRYVTERFVELWSMVFKNVWAQWRYENNLPDFTVEIIDQRSSRRWERIDRDLNDSVKTLAFCGGGKDSFLTLSILKAAGIAHETLGYSSSSYGAARQQHKLIERLVRHGAAVRHHKQWVYDDFLDAPVLELLGSESKSLTGAETPSSIFGCLPIVLQHGFRYIALGHERSADTGQVHWEQTGEDVNHQWGKSLEAERAINAYLGAELLSDFAYYSILKPIHDVLTFSHLSLTPEVAFDTHSCNVDKPWCRRCAKCVYVLLNYAAYLPKDVVLRILEGDDIFNAADNQYIFRQLMGLEDQLPFECIGQTGEVLIGMELARLNGWTGRAIDTYVKAARPSSFSTLVDRYTRHYAADSGIPKELAPRLLPVFDAIAEQGRALLKPLVSAVA